MKVLRIIPSMNPLSGGPCQGIRNILTHLERAGVYTEVVCMDEPTEYTSGKDAFIIHQMGPGKSAWQYCPKLLGWLIDNLHRFDVVIIHALWLYHGYAFRKAMKIIKQSGEKKENKFKLPKYYVMPHGMLDPYFQRAEGRKLKAFRNWAYWKLIESKLVNEATGILFTCEEELLLAKKTFSPYQPQKEINIGYGLPTPPQNEPLMKKAFIDKCPEVGDHPYILFISRIHEKKGISQLIEAYAKFIERNENINDSNGGKQLIPQLVIAGPGLETPFGKKMQSIVFASQKLKASIFFPGMLTQKAKWGAFYNCDAFILPSHQENFGIAVVEALACARPVLISYQVNIWREIIESGAGIIADDTVDGAELLIDSWIRLSQVSKNKMSEQAFKCFKEEFDIRPAVERFCNLLASPELEVIN